MIKLVKSGDRVVINVSEFYGLESDVPNLPVNGNGYNGFITTGSTFFCIDSGATWMFEEASNQWYEL